MDIGVAAVMTPIGATPGHSTDHPNIVSHATEAQVHTTTAVTHHTTDCHPIETFPKMTADLNTKSQKQHYKPIQGSSSGSQATPWKIKTEDTNKSQLTDPPSKYYSSDEQDSDSEDDLN